jgi:predicted Zn-dependent protease
VTADDSSDPLVSVEVALEHAAQLLASEPALALEQANEILTVSPNHPLALLTQGLALGNLGQGDQSLLSLQRALALQPDLADGWRALGDHFAAIGDSQAADQAYARHIRAATRDPRLLQAAAALCDNCIAAAEALLRAHLLQHPTDVPALRMLAEVAARLGRFADAEVLLERCLALAPSFAAARHNYALVLYRHDKPEGALREINQLLQREPRNAGYRSLKAAILGRIGEYAQSIELYAGVLAEYPGQAKLWMSYGHALKTAGNQQQSVSAYRKSIEINAALGEAYWSLANLKTVRFAPSDIAAMQSCLAQARLGDEDRFHLHFALGKAFEDADDYAESFTNYARGNAIRRQGLYYDADETHRYVERCRALFTESFFAARSGSGCLAGDPVFIVGLPRSGSTLLEQILSSHSQVEGTMELPDIVAMARRLGERRKRADVSRYPEALATLQPEELRLLGEEYLTHTRIQRKTDKPFFVDKLPNNFAHIGMIQLILPNARVIDARRHPLGCCFSAFKQHFARGQNFSYDLVDLGRYYRDYVELMAHFDAVLPGRVHRVIYENLIEHTEVEVRSLLDYCGLPFEQQCLRFHETARPVRTASSEQVRQPIYRQGIDQWRHYDAWLAPLRAALGAVLDCYPEVPLF